MVSGVARVRPIAFEGLAASDIIMLIANWLLGVALSNIVTSTFKSTFKKVWNRPKQHRVDASRITAHARTSVPTVIARASASPPAWL